MKEPTDRSHPISTDTSFRFSNNQFDKMPCKLESTENPRMLKYPIPPDKISKEFPNSRKFLQLKNFQRLVLDFHSVVLEFLEVYLCTDLNRCETKGVKQVMWNKWFETNGVQQTVCNKRCKTKNVNQEMWNKWCETREWNKKCESRNLKQEMINKKFVLKQEVSNKKCLDTRETPEIRDTLVPTEKWFTFRRNVNFEEMWSKWCETRNVKHEVWNKGCRTKCGSCGTCSQPAMKESSHIRSCDTTDSTL